ncbi:MAG: FAD-binding oxidoreductase [SAR324 cluster bacterium]|nr:FAD-binding oxidoreductase [SAR324 cluster bacterium]MEC9360935.1 FAD-binding oxidoreductase [SAR324 cluster bacterium]
MKNKRTTDYIIIGGGIIGCSTAYNLANQGAKSVIVLEKGEICSGATSKSCAITRSHYSIESNVHHAVESVKIFENFDEIIGGDPGFTRTGQIVLGPEKHRPLMESVFSTQNKFGSETQTLTPSEAGKLHPLLQFQDVDVIGFELRSGYCDPYLTTVAYAQRAKDLGVKIYTAAPVNGIRIKGPNKIVETPEIDFETSEIILAAGPWTNALGKMIEVNFPYEISKHKVLTLKIDQPYQKDWPIVKDLLTPEKIYFRPDSGGVVLVGTGDHGEPIEDVETMNNEVEADHIERIGKRMANRMPAFADAKMVRSWTGPYDIPPDWNPIIGPVPGITGVHVAVGFSGHGFKLAPTVGESLAQQVLGKKPRVPIDMYDMTRFKAGKTLNGAYGIGTFA